jgi:hypothetical protein
MTRSIFKDKNYDVQYSVRIFVDNSWGSLTTHPNVDSLRAGGFSSPVPRARVALDVVQAFFAVDLQEGNWVKTPYMLGL